MTKKQLNKNGDLRGMHGFHEGNKGHKHPGINSKPKITLICKYCGIEFHVAPHLKDRQFCSRDHKDKWMSENSCGENNPNWKPKIKLLCKKCGNTFYVTESRKDSAKFCSKKCYSEWQIKNTSGENHPGYNIPLTDEHIQKLSDSHKGYELSDTHKQHISAGLQGISYTEWKEFSEKQKYCHLFNLPLKEAIRLYFDNKCFMDNEPESNGNALSVHHVGYDKRCGCDATQFCIFIPVKAKWNGKFNGGNGYNRWYWYSFLMNKIFMLHPNYFTYHIPVWGMCELEYNYDYVFEKFRRR